MQSLQILHIIFATVFMLLAGPGEERPGANIAFKDGHLTINGMGVADNWTSADFHAALGKSETEDGRKEGYETKGIVVWREGTDYVEVSEFKLNFKPDDNESWETNLQYGGTVSLEGIFINSQSTPDKLSAELPQYNWFKNTSGWLEGVYKDIGVLIRYTDDWKTPIWIDFSLKND